MGVPSLDPAATGHWTPPRASEEWETPAYDGTSPEISSKISSLSS